MIERYMLGINYNKSDIPENNAWSFPASQVKIFTVTYLFLPGRPLGRFFWYRLSASRSRSYSSFTIWNMMAPGLWLLPNRLVV